MEEGLKILQAIWGSSKGYVFVPRKKGKTWNEGRAFKYPDEWEAIKARIRKSVAEGYDVYWCPLLFSQPKRVKDYVLPTANILWADLDECDPRKLGSLKPAIAWESSTGRYQALWLIDHEGNINEVEQVNRQLTYHIGADKGGWDITQVLRVPGSLNHKYNPPREGKLLWAKKHIISLDTVKSLTTYVEPEATSTETLEELMSGWKIPKRIKQLLDVTEVPIDEDRSARLWEIETGLIEAGLPVFQVVKIVKASAWNKFRGRRDEDKQIYQEVIKAEQHVKTSAVKIIDEKTEKIKQDLWAVPYTAFMSKHIGKPEWLVEHIWQDGTYGLIAGEPKTFKSVMSTDLALSVASGVPFLGRFPVHKQGPVLYVQEENNEQTMQDRLAKIAHNKNLFVHSFSGEFSLPEDLPIYLSNNYGINLKEESSKEMLEESISKLKPVLVILDPLYMMIGDTDENSSKEVGEVLRWLTYIRNEYKCSIILCHHYNKGGTSTRGGQRVRGSSTFHGWVESALYVKATATPNNVKVSREFRAYPMTEDLDITFTIGEPGELLYRVTLNEEEGKSPDLLREDICAILSVSPRTADEIQALTKCTRNELRRTLKELELDGVIVKNEGGGRGKQTKYVLSPEGVKH